jgi:hypothetical protein
MQFQYFALAVILTFITLNYVKNPSSILLWMMIGLGVVLTIICSGFWAREIQIHEDKIAYKGLNKSSTIYFNDVKSIGIFQQYRSNRIPIKPENLDKESKLLDKFISVGTNKNQSLNSAINDEFIFFQYRKSAFDQINLRIIKTPPNNGEHEEPL